MTTGSHFQRSFSWQSSHSVMQLENEEVEEENKDYEEREREEVIETSGLEVMWIKWPNGTAQNKR